MDKKTHTSRSKSSHISFFPPVVAVLGHVDHGKTTLLDAIRKTSIAEREHGGITQKIGASSIEVDHEGIKRKITFIDTPGHEAFAKMRGRGAGVSDIALLIISSVDGIMPQTKESIALLQQTHTPFIVVLTKSDMETKNPEKVKKDLLKEQVALEGYGGDIPVIEVSARTGHNVKELLDLILLLFDLQHRPDDAVNIAEKAQLKAIVIESKLDTRAGPKATVVIKNGSIHARDVLSIDGMPFKVRTIINDRGESVQSATVGQGVELLGFEKVPGVGAVIADAAGKIVAGQLPVEQKPLQRSMVYKKAEKAIELSILLVADTQGSLEAIVHALPQGIRMIEKKTGEVNEADVMMAKSTGGIILSFNTKVKPNVLQLAYTEKIVVRNYTIIYELLSEVTDALEGKVLAQTEQIFGKAKILATFPFEKTLAYGVAVTEGRIARGDHVRLMRNDEPVGEGAIQSLRVGKNPQSKVEKGHEAGLVLGGLLDIRVGDMLLSHS